MQPADNRPSISFFGQVTRIDDRRVLWPRRARLDIAARQGPHLPWAAGQPRLCFEFTDLTVLEAARGKRDLHIGGGRLRQYLDRGGNQRRAVGQHPLAGDQIAHDLGRERQAPRSFIRGRHAVNRIGDPHDIMILHVLADAGQRMMGFDADLCEMLGIADPGQLQQMR